MTSEEFKALRLSMGLSQFELGQMMGMPILKNQCSAINRIETTRKPTAIHAAFIREIYKNQLFK